MAVGGSATSVQDPGISAVFSDPSSLRFLGTTNSVDKARMPWKVEYTVNVHIFYKCTHRGQLAKPYGRPLPIHGGPEAPRSPLNPWGLQASWSYHNQWNPPVFLDLPRR